MSVRTLYKGQFLTFKRDAHWEYVSRERERGAAFIVALTDARELLLVEQWRIPLQAPCIELPAGIIGDEEGHEDEGIIPAALRELEEETGYRARGGELLLTGPVAAGLTSEPLYLVRARDLRRVHAGGGVGSEDITVHVVPLARAHDWLQEQAARGTLIEPRIYAALWFAERD